MSNTDPFEIFLQTAPGLEPALRAEASEVGFDGAEVVPGGVTLRGGWPEVWRANLSLRGADRVLARVGSFRAMHLAQLDKRSRKFPWPEVLRADVPVKVETTCHASRIYHAGAATQRIETALREELGVTVTPQAALGLRVRIADDLVTFSLDTSGAPLHKRGHKPAVGKAPMRETYAALFLRQCGYDGREPVLDPMCGSGTFVIEAAEWAAGLMPGRSREFAFEQLASFDAEAWTAMRGVDVSQTPSVTFRGSDRDDGAIRMSGENAERAGVKDWTVFQQGAVAELERPEGPPGLVIVNPPYGARIGNKALLYAVYATLGQRLKEGFKGWRVGIVTTETGFARATGLPFKPVGPVVPHGGLKVRLYQTGVLK
ncbi:class I SAM-dependent RNA methyltransferase [Puniceibacterium sp. IMCC21224]|uniref:THUMP domain-containing class I SAM-dependent RNA methyltransferase n=1 Tax=Puniceibacterium sp. IMCC21224 TaxID=1618204 RepID=UPI00064DDB25|nr:RNA methyltransferase [Puniceibacterium sp. IMCC21224]KMK68634.1 putative N6-adenine-specific DNA methylase [Puniceibacterium sp. IMCC21224]